MRLGSLSNEDCAPDRDLAWGDPEWRKCRDPLIAGSYGDPPGSKNHGDRCSGRLHWAIRGWFGRQTRDMLILRVQTARAGSNDMPPSSQNGQGFHSKLGFHPCVPKRLAHVWTPWGNDNLRKAPWVLISICSAFEWQCGSSRTSCMIVPCFDWECPSPVGGVCNGRYEGCMRKLCD